MVLRTLAAPAAICLLTASLHAQGLDDAGIARALKAGTDDKFSAWTAECRAEASRSERRARRAPEGNPTGSYDVVLSTNLGAIAFLAHQAKKAQGAGRLGGVHVGLESRGERVRRASETSARLGRTLATQDANRGRAFLNRTSRSQLENRSSICSAEAGCFRDCGCEFFGE